MKALLGRKIGMTQIYDPHGAVQAVTVIQAGPCVVTDVKTVPRDGYQAFQLGFETSKKFNQAAVGHLKASGQSVGRYLREFPLLDAADAPDVGQTVTVSIFTPGEFVNVRATSKGKGFSGVVKRHGFAGGPGSHGSDFHRAPGSIGGRWPQRVPKGKRMAGQMGNQQVTVRRLPILAVDHEQNLLAVKGAVPGPRRALVMVEGREENR